MIKTCFTRKPVYKSKIVTLTYHHGRIWQDITSVDKAFDWLSLGMVNALTPWTN